MEWSGHRRGAELGAYREFISSMAQTRQWEQVWKYNWEFRKAAAGQKDMSWAEVNATLFVTEIVPSQPVVVGVKRTGYSEGGSKKRLRESGGQAGRMFGMRRAMGPCFRYNKDGEYSYGEGCQFRHNCTQCGGKNPACQYSGGTRGWHGGGQWNDGQTRPGGGQWNDGQTRPGGGQTGPRIN